MNTDNKTLAIIGSGEMAVIIAENAQKLGIATHTFSNDIHDRVVGISDEHHCISIFDTDKIIEVCKSIGADGVMPTTELTISVAAEVADALNLKGMAVDVSRKVTDKSYVRNKAAAVEYLKQPKYSIWTVGESFPTIEKYPVIVKPTNMGGKRGISVAYSDKDLSGALMYSQDNMPSTKNQIIIEEFISGGKEYSVEGLSFDGNHDVIQITEKITSGPPHCVELGHLQPAALSKKMREKVVAAVQELLETVGVNNTSSHTEIKIVDNQIYLIELNARFGGDHIAYPLTELSTGYPYIIGAIEGAVGNYKKPNTEGFEKTSCGVIFVADQTRNFKPLFDVCEKYPWLYKKNITTDKLVEIVNNHAFDTNYMIFKSNVGIPVEIKELLNNIGKNEVNS